MQDPSLNKLPPHSIEAEQWVLGAILLDNRTLPQVASVLDTKDLYAPKHQKIYSSMLIAYKKYDAVDLVTLSQELSFRGALEDVGGEVYLVGLLEAVPTAVNAPKHAKIIKQKAVLRRVGNLGCQMYLQSFEPDTDPESLIEMASQEFFDVSRCAAGYDPEKDVLSGYQIASQAYNDIIEQKKPPQTKGLNVGFFDFDNLLGGVRGLTFITGDTGLGKSGLALNWVKYLAIEQKIPTLVLNHEMTLEASIDRLLALTSGVAIRRIEQYDKLDPEEIKKLTDALGIISESPIFITNNMPKTIAADIALIHQHSIKHELRVVVIDYLGEMARDELSLKSKDQYEWLGRYTQDIKDACNKLGVTPIILHQINRSGEQGKKASAGSYEPPRKADLWLQLYPLMVRNEKKKLVDSGDLILMVDKNRHGMSPAYFRLEYNREKQIFTEKGWCEPSGKLKY